LQVGTDNDGKVQYLKADFYENAGSSWNEKMVSDSISFMTSCYDNSTWKVKGYGVRSDIPSTTWCRGPGTVLKTNLAVMTFEQCVERF
jgi:CO/xanthine dehydrogenase Mo-binding subunit